MPRLRVRQTSLKHSESDVEKRLRQTKKRYGFEPISLQLNLDGKQHSRADSDLQKKIVERLANVGVKGVAARQGQMERVQSEAGQKLASALLTINQYDFKFRGQAQKSNSLKQ
jgi:hypothetical protein